MPNQLGKETCQCLSCFSQGLHTEEANNTAVFLWVATTANHYLWLWPCP